MLDRASSIAIAGATVAVAALLLAGTALPVGFAVLGVILPFAAWYVVQERESRGARIDLHLLVVAIGALLVLAVTQWPAGSHDIWSYTMYGRMVSQYGVSPYSHVPRDFPTDPFLHLVSPGWRNTPSVYGPVFVAFSTAATFVAGSSVLLARLFQQVSAALAVSVALGLIWWRTRRAAALMLVGLNPLVIVSVVNGGHNDALVGLAVLGAALLAERDRPAAAGAVLAVGALVKITALLALPALAVWLFVRHGRRAASSVVGGGVAATLLGYALAGPSAISALNANHRLMSRASVWQVGRTIAGLNGRTHLFGLMGATWLAVFGLGAVGLTGTLALLVAWWRRHDSELGVVVALAVTTYLIAGLYVLPWYGMWMLPAAALGRRRGPLVYAAVLAAFLTAIYAIRDRALPATVSTGWWWLGAYLGPALLLLAFVYVVLDRAPGPDGTAAPIVPWRRRPPVPAAGVPVVDVSR